MDDHLEGPQSLPRPLLAIALGVITLGAAADLVMDRPERLLTLHVLAEFALLCVSLGTAGFLAKGWYLAQRELRSLASLVRVSESERDEWRARAGRLLRGLAEEMATTFDAWRLTPTERETALMLLKGHSHKRIGRLTGRSDRTVRQHAVALYRKAGLAGRSELSAFFLDDLLLPTVEDSAGPRS
jgi:DNA-binding NarL/FixJ family response regulator